MSLIKKLMPIKVILMAIIVLSGCSQNNGIAAEYGTPYRAFREYAVNDKDHLYEFREQGGVNTPGGGLLSYVNKGSGDWQILCWRPGCLHATEDCPAYYNAGHRLLNATLDGRIRVLEFKKKGHQLVIWEVNTHKSTKNRLASFDLDQLSDGKGTEYISALNFGEYQGILYLIFPSTYIGDKGSRVTTTWLIRINLETLNAEESICLQDTQFPESFPVIHKILLIEENKLYIVLADREIGEEGAHRPELRLYSFDLDTRTLEDTGFAPEDDALYCLIGHQVFYREPLGDGKYSLIKKDLHTGEKQAILEMPDGAVFANEEQYLGYVSITYREAGENILYPYMIDLDTAEKYKLWVPGSKVYISYANEYAAYYEILENPATFTLGIEKVSP
ncbi:MAG: hypothetical protein IJK56_03600 [Firmicutes bacterium]|nr:hypothetical protein [Bacillota bacterium]